MAATHVAVTDLDGRLLPLVAVCPGCAGRELVGHGTTWWVCHGRVVTVTVAS